jgi:hypothetical protein
MSASQWPHFGTMCFLGNTLLAQGKGGDAERLIGEGYDGFVAHRPANDGMFRMIARSLIECAVDAYDARGMSDRAAEWRKELERIK